MNFENNPHWTSVEAEIPPKEHPLEIGMKVFVECDGVTERCWKITKIDYIKSCIVVERLNGHPDHPFKRRILLAELRRLNPELWDGGGWDDETPTIAEPRPGSDRPTP